MIIFMTGVNDFAHTERLREIFAGESYERISGADILYDQLVDIFAGSRLFGDDRRVVIEDLSERPDVWQKMPDLIARHMSDVPIVILEHKPDKRTSVYKTLVAHATLIEHGELTERDGVQVEKWLIGAAAEMGLSLTSRLAKLLIARVGHDQWMLYTSLQVLALGDTLDEEAIIRGTQQSLQANVFELLALAFRGEVQDIQRQIFILREQEDAYKTFALIVSQVLQLAAVVFAGAQDDPVGDFGIHPYVAGKLRQQARHISKTQIRSIVDIVARSDDQLKLAKAEPWFIVEQALQKIAARIAGD